eukprot:1161873-Pelagomonas_calceolata.AAC.5
MRPAWPAALATLFRACHDDNFQILFTQDSRGTRKDAGCAQRDWGVQACCCAGPCGVHTQARACGRAQRDWGVQACCCAGPCGVHTSSVCVMGSVARAGREQSWRRAAPLVAAAAAAAAADSACATPAAPAVAAASCVLPVAAAPPEHPTQTVSPTACEKRGVRAP